MFVDSYDKICKEMGVSPTAILGELGISKGTYSNWKSNGANPTNPTMKKIADYFGISVTELEAGEIKKAPQTGGDNEMLDLLENIRRKPGMRTLFSLSKNATPEQLKTYRCY